MEYEISNNICERKTIGITLGIIGIIDACIEVVFYFTQTVAYPFPLALICEIVSFTLPVAIVVFIAKKYFLFSSDWFNLIFCFWVLMDVFLPVLLQILNMIYFFEGNVSVIKIGTKMDITDFASVVCFIICMISCMIFGLKKSKIITCLTACLLISIYVAAAYYALRVSLYVYKIGFMNVSLTNLYRLLLDSAGYIGLGAWMYFQPHEFRWQYKRAQKL